MIKWNNPLSLDSFFAIDIGSNTLNPVTTIKHKEKFNYIESSLQ